MFSESMVLFSAFFLNGEHDYFDDQKREKFHAVIVALTSGFSSLSEEI